MSCLREQRHPQVSELTRVNAGGSLGGERGCGVQLRAASQRTGHLLQETPFSRPWPVQVDLLPWPLVSARSFRLSVGIRPPYGCPLCLDILVPHRKDSNVSVFIHSGVSLLSRAQGPGQVRGHRGVYQGWPWVDLLSLVQVAIASVIWSHSQHPWEAALDDVDTQKEMK